MSRLFTSMQLYEAFISAAGNLKDHQDLLNHINVFPVADQDTGKNMMLSLEAACSVLNISDDPINMIRHAADTLLEQARGNSGTILSLFFQGFASAISESNALDCWALAAAFSKGAETAINGIADPRPGTILTLAVKAAETGASFANSTDDPSILMKRIADEAFSVLPLTTFQNPALEKYHVIDSGALGFCMVLDGFCSGFSGNVEHRDYSEFDRTSIDFDAEVPVNQFCTEFLINRPSDKAIKVLKQQLSQMGDCIIPAVDSKHLKIHIHTNRPDAVFFVASLCGRIRRTKVDNMLLSCNISETKADVFLCKSDLTFDGLRSMGKTYVFIADENGFEEIRNAVASLNEQNIAVTLYASVNVNSDLADTIPRIRYFSDDDAMLDYVFAG